MTPTAPAVATDSEIRSNAGVENPAETARARHPRETPQIVTRCHAEFLRASKNLTHASRHWWIVTTRPMSIKAAWRAGRLVDVGRVPIKIRWLELLWRWDNRIGTRPLFFLLAMVAPHTLAGPILWCAARPSRRLGALVVTTALTLGLYLAARF